MKDKNFLIENGVDVEKGIELLGDIETYNEMLNDFITESEEKIKNLENFIEQKDMENYAILAHALKSNSKYFGFTKLIEIAYNHELESKNNNFEFISNNFEELKNETSRIISLIKEYLEK